MEREYLSVSLLTRYVKQKFDRDPYLERVFLRGEISNYNRNRPNSHQYFSLKDEQSKINAVMFQTVTRSLRFMPEEGMQVLVVGRLTVYEKTGVYQIIIDHMEPDGVGQLYQALEQTKRKLKAEGLFDIPKKLLPKYPKRIAVITSPSGAVIRDIITTVKRRYPIVQLVLYPTLVQGERAADSIVQNIHRANKKNEYDVIIVARGGGSIEDLWPFNEERVARAISDSAIPIISSVGHETDTTLADLTADVRAATPTAAAELSVPVLQEEILQVEQTRLRLHYLFRTLMEKKQDRLMHLSSSYVFRQPQRLYERYVQNLDTVSEKLKRTMQTRVTDQKQTLQLHAARLEGNHPGKLLKQKKQEYLTLNKRLDKLQIQIIRDKEERLGFAVRSLDYLSPLKILERGYSFVRDEKGSVIKEEADVQKGELIRIQLHKGQIEAEVTNKGVEQDASRRTDI